MNLNGEVRVSNNNLAEFYDSVDELLATINCYDAVGKDVLRKELHRVASAMSNVREQVEKSSGAIDEKEIDISLSDEVVNLGNDEFSKLMKDISEKRSIRVEDSRTSKTIKVSINDIQAAYTRIKGNVCSMEQAQEILDRVVNNFNPRVALVNQFRSEIDKQEEIENNISKDDNDENLDALASLGFS